MTFVILDKKKRDARFVWRIGEVIDGGDARYGLSHVRRGPLDPYHRRGRAARHASYRAKVALP